MLTLISHFYNEEFLLPYWLDHHRRIFDHGILVDYDSTDRSIQIIKDICPTWTVLTSRNRVFDCYECDKEIMDIERSVCGWKMVLNTTEFVICHRLRERVDEFPDQGCIKTQGVWLVDSPNEYDQPLSTAPLFFQRTHGWFESKTETRMRIVHNFPDGKYKTGRHLSNLPRLFFQDIFTVWAGWSPYPQVKQRKLQIKARIPPKHYLGGMGAEHNITPDQADEQYKIYSAQAGNLLHNPTYAEVLKKVRKVMYPERLIWCHPSFELP